MDEINKRWLILDQLKWMAIYLGIAFAIMILLPFPIDLAVALSVFLLLSLYRRMLLLRKLGIVHERSSETTNIPGLKNIKDFFKSLSLKASHSVDHGPVHIKYYCMKCGNEHREVSCPKCGSKMKRIG